MTPRAKELAITILRMIAEGNLGGGDVGTFAKLDDIIEEIGSKEDVESVINNFLLPMRYIVKVNTKFKKIHGYELEYVAYQIKELGKTYLRNQGKAFAPSQSNDADEVSQNKINRLDQLIKNADTVLGTHKPNPPGVIGFPTLDEGHFQQWKASSDNIIKTICGASSSYAANFAKTVKQAYSSHVEAGKGILIALKEDIEAGVYNQPLSLSRRSFSDISAANITSDTVSLKISSDVYEHIKKYLDTEDYFHAVEESYKFVREKLKDITGKEKATDIFNMNAENTKYHAQIFGKQAETGSPEADFFRGVGYLNLTIQFLRNEKMHTLATTLDKNLAIHYISLASLAYDLISRSEEE